MSEKQKRTSAKGTFTRAANNYDKIIGSDSCKEDVENIFIDVEKAWRNVEDKHEQYVATLDDDESVEAEERWISDIQVRFYDIRKRYVKFKSNFDLNLRLQALERARTVEHDVFLNFYSNLESSVNNKYPIETISREKASLARQFEEVKQKHSEFCVHSTNLDESVHKKFLGDLISKLAVANSIAEDYIQSCRSKTELKRSEANINNVKMDKLPLPKFRGEARFYRRFKRDFYELVVPNLKAREAVFALRQCLSAEVEGMLGSGDYELGQIFKRLDEKYGDPGKMTDAIISEIQRFKKIEDEDNKRVIEFVNIIERAFHDLQSVDMEKEINNTNVVSIIESKLPKTLALSWYRFIHSGTPKVDKANKFPHLLDFLRNERSALEYGLSDLRILSDKRYVTVNYVNNSSNLKCLIHNTDSHKTAECRSYMALLVKDRYELLKERSACFSCLSPEHMMSDCKSQVKCLNCNKFHHSTLHSVTNKEEVNVVMDPYEKSGISCIFPIMKVKVKGKDLGFANVLWDCCASVCLITDEKAKELGLSGFPSSISLTVVGGIEQNLESTSYRIPLIDLQGRTFIIEAHSIDKISDDIKDIDLDKVQQFFPNIDISELRRPKGRVDIIIGYKYAAWHPVRERSNDHMLILANSFGKCVGGSHPEICERTKRNEKVSFIVNYVSSKSLLSEFSIIENLGVEFIPKCGRCFCGNCPLGGKNCTIKEEREMALIDKNLEFSKNGYWIAGYPWVKNMNNLPDNRYYAFKLLLQTERRLEHDPTYKKLYCEQIQDLLDRGVARKLDKAEMQHYKGPVHYLAHHGIMNPMSKSTVLRIVFNPSANFKGHILNDYWAKGPNVFVNTLLGILIRFRENYVGFMGDISKMYHSVRILLRDQHCHRFLWRDMNCDIKEPYTYAITRVNMGDKPGGCISSSALKKTAEMNQDEFPEEAEVIIKSSYMDDIIDSTDNKEKAYNLTKNITDILKTADFKIKEWIISHTNLDTSVNFQIFETKSELEKVLGMRWSVKGDYFIFIVKLNFSKRKNKIHTGPNVESHNVEENVPLNLTKRMILSQINGLYDPLGAVTPFVIKGKILLRYLWTAKLDWDDTIPQEMRLRWVQFFTEMFELSDIVFKRSVKPKDATSLPILVIFSDASKEAYGACAYVRWEVEDGKYVSSLLLSKSKIAPIKVITIVCLELLGAVIGIRLRLTIQKECRYNFERIIHIVDSEIVRAMIQRESYGFNTFTSTKIGEIQEGSDPNDWYWVSGENNVADLITRGERPSNLGLGSIWQDGPAFLRLPIEQWPIRQDCSTTVLPEQVETVMTVNLNEANKVIDLDSYSDYVQLIRVTARILSLLQKRARRSLKQIAEDVTIEKFDGAVKYWVIEAQKPILPELRRGTGGKGKFRKLSPILRDDGIYVVGGRAVRWFEASYNKQLIPILPKGRFSILYVEYIHRRAHAGVDSDMARVRSEYWIVGLHQICSSIRYNCVICKRKHASCAAQVMGKLPIERLKPAPAWSTVGIDLFGPFEIRGEVNKRSTCKVYGVIYCCLPTTAVYLDIASDYSTDAFLMVLRRFVSLRGYPSIIYSDSGPQLVGASNVLKAVSKNYDWDEIESFGVDKGIKWNFSPGEAPWWNGLCESLIRSVKKSIVLAVGSHRLSFSELQTVCFEAGNLANERPIGVKPGGYSEHSYLCPNDLLLGRATQRVPAGPWNESKNIAKRYYFVQGIVDLFWKKWTLCYLPNLIIQPKWHVEKRNVAVGDIVIIVDKDIPRGRWKLGKISRVEQGIDNKVRKLWIIYKNKNSDTFTTIERPVQRVVVILPVDENS